LQENLLSFDTNIILIKNSSSKSMCIPILLSHSKTVFFLTYTILIQIAHKGQYPVTILFYFLRLYKDIIRRYSTKYFY